jgi:tetratricopeptide (TPR) repeat protein
MPREQHPMPTPVDAALAHHRAGRLDEAATLYLQSLEAQPDCAFVLNMLGNVEYQRNHVDDALRLIGRAIQIEPSSSTYRITLGHVYRRLDDLASAATCYRAALRLSPESCLAAMSLAGALKGQGELTAASEVLQGILARDPNHLEALGMLGDLWLELERPAEAIRVFRQFLAIDPASSDATFRLGVAANQQGEPALAIACFEKAISLRPDSSEALYNLGVMAAEALKFDSAEEWFRRALAVRPEYVEAHVNLSAVLLKTGRAADSGVHREIAYRRKCLFERTSRAALRTVLVLFDAGRGNINLSHLFSPTRNSVIDWMIEYAALEQSETLPPFDLVFNAMGDPDMAGAAALPASRFVAGCAKPVLNLPESVARTSRHRMPALLEGIDGLLVPKVWRVSPDDQWPAEIADHLPVSCAPRIHTAARVCSGWRASPSSIALLRTGRAPCMSRSSAISVRSTAGTGNIESSSSTGSPLPTTWRYRRIGWFTTPRPAWRTTRGSSRKSAAFSGPRKSPWALQASLPLPRSAPEWTSTIPASISLSFPTAAFWSSRRIRSCWSTRKMPRAYLHSRTPMSPASSTPSRRC